MKIYDREVTIILVKHNGKGLIQDQFDVSSSLISLGDKTWTVSGSELVKIQTSTISFKLLDVDDVIWLWLNNNLQSEEGLIPPFVLIFVDEEPYFVGTIPTEQIKKKLSTRDDYLEFSCEDWSRLLKSIDVSSLLKRSLPKKVNDGDVRLEKTKVGNSPPKYYIWAATRSRYYRNQVPSTYNRQIVYFPLDADWLIEGDRVKDDSTGLYYSVTKVWNEPTRMVVMLEGFSWPTPNFWECVKRIQVEREGREGNTIYGYETVIDLSKFFTRSFTRQASNTEETVFLRAQETVPASTDGSNRYSVKVNSVNGVYPGDKVNHFAPSGKQTDYEIRDINSETNQLFFTEPISAKISDEDMIGLDAESYEYAMFETFEHIVDTACGSIGSVANFNRFEPCELPRPFLSWLPFRGPAGNILSAPNNINVGYTDIRVKGPDKQSWIGTPEAGYTKQASDSWSEVIDWTSQLTSAPPEGNLMPYNTAKYTTYVLRPNKPRTMNGLWDLSDRADNNQPRGFYVYTYRTEANQSSSVEVTVSSSTTTYKNWTFQNGSWVAGSTSTTTTSAQVPLCGVSFNNELADSILLLQKNGYLQLRTQGGTILGTLAVPSEPKGGTLARTPYGVYLLGTMGAYGKVSWNNNQLALTTFTPTIQTVGVEKVKGFRFYETSLVALNANDLYVLGNVQVVKDKTAKGSQQEVIEEVWLFKLDPSAVNNCPIPEKVADGSYSIVRAVKDPNGERILGILGGRLFQIANTVSATFMRLKPTSSALELIEHCCIAQNAVAYPNEAMTFNLISRNLSETALPITLNITSDEETRTKDFYSIFEVKGSNDLSWTWTAPGMGADASSELTYIQKGGGEFSLDCQDYVSTQSQCASLGADYAEFYGKPRRGREVQVIHLSGGASAFEVLLPLQRVRINNETSEWHVMSVGMNLDGVAKIKLLQAL